MTSWTSLPANYAKPTSVAVTYGDPSHKPNRTVTTSSAYNDEGLQTSATNAAGNDHRHHLQLLRAAGDPDGDRHGRVDQRHHRHLHR